MVAFRRRIRQAMWSSLDRLICPLAFIAAIVAVLPVSGDDSIDEAATVSAPALPPRALVQLGSDAFRHSDAINGIAYSPDDRWIVTTANNQPNYGAYLWDTATGRMVRHLAPETDEIAWSTCVAYSSDGAKVAAGDYLGNVTIWETATGNVLYSSQRHARGVSCLAFVPRRNLLVSAGADGRVRLMDVRNLDLAAEVQSWSVQLPSEKPANDDAAAVGQQAAGALAVSADGKRVAVARTDNATLFVWDVDTGRRVTTIAAAHQSDPDAPATLGPAATVTSLAFIDGGSKIVSCGYRITPREKVKAAHAPQGVPVLDMRLWDVTKGTSIRNGPEDQMYSFGPMARSTDGRLLATADSGAIHLWKAGEMKPLRILAVPDGLWSAPLAFSYDGKRLVAGTGQTVSIWDVESGEQLAGAGEKGIHGGMQSAAWSQGGENVALGFGGGIEVRSAQSGQIKRVLSMGKTLGPFSWTARAWGVEFSADGKTLVACGDRDDEDEKKYRVGTVRAFDTGTGEMRAEIVTEREVRSMALSPDGKQVVLATSNDGTDSQLFLFEVETAKQVAALPKLVEKTGIDSPKVMIFSPAGRHVHMACQRGKVLRWNPADGTIDREFLADWRVPPADLQEYKTPWLAGAVFSPDGTTLVTAGGTVLAVWDVETGKLKRSQRFDNTRAPFYLSITPDGRTLATAHANYSGEISPTWIELWDVETGEARLRLECGQRAHVISFSADGTKLLTGFVNGTAMIWDVR